jgi:hypothetical protein
LMSGRLSSVIAVTPKVPLTKRSPEVMPGTSWSLLPAGDAPGAVLAELLRLQVRHRAGLY